MIVATKWMKMKIRWWWARWRIYPPCPPVPDLKMSELEAAIGLVLIAVVDSFCSALM